VNALRTCQHGKRTQLRLLALSREIAAVHTLVGRCFVTFNLHSPERRLIELRIEHADLDAWIDRLVEQSPVDQLMLQRLKKRRLALRDAMAQLEAALEPKEPA
jgi:hypothetical protein